LKVTAAAERTPAAAAKPAPVTANVAAEAAAVAKRSAVDALTSPNRGVDIASSNTPIHFNTVY
jgi:hypothetical protein